jgi:hypothetical protein
MTQIKKTPQLLMQFQVGNEFSQVEGLWSQFENVMANQPESDASKASGDGAPNA